MKNEQHGGLDVVLTGGTDREGGGTGPLVVLLHGFGAPGTNLVGLYRVLDVPPEVRFAFPAAPLSLGFGSRAWWEIDMVALQRALASSSFREQRQATPDGLADVRSTLDACLTSLCESLKVPEAGLVLGGFSQGSMASLDYAIESTRPLAGLVLLSSTILSEPRWRVGLPSRAGLPVFQSHGQADPILSFDLAEDLKAMLESAGLPVTWNAFRGAHEIPGPVLEELGRFIRKVVEGA